MDRIKATFYLPLRDNQGRDLAGAIGAVAEACFLAFGGWTFLGHYEGAWRMGTGEQQLDTSAAYSVVLPAERLVELEAVLLEFKARAGQEVIYLEIDRHIDVRFI